MHKTGQTPRVVVVGAGIGGLVSALVLAHHGLDVSLLESAALQRLQRALRVQGERARRASKAGEQGRAGKSCARTGLSLIIKRSYGGLTNVTFMPSALAPDGQNKASHVTGQRPAKAAALHTDINQVRVRLQADQHERRRRRRGQTRDEEGRHFDGERLGAHDERRVARQRG